MRVMSHLAVGAASWVWLAGDGLVSHDPRAAVLVLAGALLPDIDHPQSWLGRRLPFLSRPIAAIFGHRGITHSLLAVALGVWLLGSESGGVWISALAVGYLSHLAADGLTPQGVPLLWPNHHRFSLPVCSTGGAMEIVVVLAVVLLALWKGGGWLLGPL